MNSLKIVYCEFLFSVTPSISPFTSPHSLNNSTFFVFIKTHLLQYVLSCTSGYEGIYWSVVDPPRATH